MAESAAYSEAIEALLRAVKEHNRHGLTTREIVERSLRDAWPEIKAAALAATPKEGE